MATVSADGARQEWMRRLWNSAPEGPWFLTHRGLISKKIKTSTKSLFFHSSAQGTVSSERLPKRQTVPTQRCLTWRIKRELGMWIKLALLRKMVKRSTICLQFHSFSISGKHYEALKRVMEQFENGTRVCPCQPACLEENYPENQGVTKWAKNALMAFWGRIEFAQANRGKLLKCVIVWDWPQKA